MAYSRLIIESYTKAELSYKLLVNRSYSQPGLGGANG